MAGIDRMTGRPLDGFAHVVQSVNLIITTRLASRVMRRHFGSSLGSLLGKMLTTANIALFFSVLAVALDLWEPRLKVVKIIPIRTSIEAVRKGSFAFVVEVEYRPRGHLGDPTPEGLRRIDFNTAKGVLTGVSS